MERYKTMNVFHNQLISPFTLYNTCLDTINAKCDRGLNLNECVDKCVNNSDCSYGYYIKQKNNKSYCLPLNNIYPDNNLLYQRHYKNNYKELEETALFMDSEKYPFPDLNINKIYNTDIVYLKNIETDLYVDQPVIPKIMISDGSPSANYTPSVITKIPINFSKYPQSLYVLNDYSSKKRELKQVIKNNNNIVLNVKDSYFIPDLINAGWIQGYGLKSYKDHELKLISYNSEDIYYGDIFILQYGSNYIGLDSNNNLQLYAESLDTLKKKKIPVSFTFEPNFDVYYCNKNVCSSINFNEIKDDIKNNTNPRDVYRDDKCFGLCNQY